MSRIIRLSILLILLIIMTTPYGFAEPETLTVIGHNNDYPFVFFDVDGRPAGYAIDFVKAFAKDEGYTLNIELYPPDQALDQFKDHGDLFYDGSFYKSIHGDKSLPLFVQEYYLYAMRSQARDIHLMIYTVFMKPLLSLVATQSVSNRDKKLMTIFLPSRRLKTYLITKQSRMCLMP